MDFLLQNLQLINQDYAIYTNSFDIMWTVFVNTLRAKVQYIRTLKPA